MKGYLFLTLQSDSCNNSETALGKSEGDSGVMLQPCSVKEIYETRPMESNT